MFSVLNYMFLQHIYVYKEIHHLPPSPLRGSQTVKILPGGWHAADPVVSVGLEIPNNNSYAWQPYLTA